MKPGGLASAVPALAAGTGVNRGLLPQIGGHLGRACRAGRGSGALRVVEVCPPGRVRARRRGHWGGGSWRGGGFTRGCWLRRSCAGSWGGARLVLRGAARWMTRCVRCGAALAVTSGPGTTARYGTPSRTRRLPRTKPARTQRPSGHSTSQHSPQSQQQCRTATCAAARRPSLHAVIPLPASAPEPAESAAADRPHGTAQDPACRMLRSRRLTLSAACADVVYTGWVRIFMQV